MLIVREKETKQLHLVSDWCMSTPLNIKKKRFAQSWTLETHEKNCKQSKGL